MDIVTAPLAKPAKVPVDFDAEFLGGYIMLLFHFRTIM